MRRLDVPGIEPFNLVLDTPAIPFDVYKIKSTNVHVHKPRRRHLESMKENEIRFLNSGELKIHRMYVVQSLTRLGKSDLLFKRCAVKVDRRSKLSACKINLPIEMGILKLCVINKSRI